MSNPLNFEPRQASPLDFYAAHSGIRTEHDPQWPGQVEEVRVVEPECVQYRKYMERATEHGCNGLADKGKRQPKPMPRIPRDTEPAHLHVVLLLIVFLVLCLALVIGAAAHGVGWVLHVVGEYADVLFPAVVKWIGGVL